MAPEPVQAFYDAYRAGDAARFQALFAPGYEGRVNGRAVRGPEEAAAFFRAFVAAFPDCRYTVHGRVDGPGGGRTAVRWSFEGTHKGPFAGVAPTGRAAQAEGLTWFEVEGGRIVRLWSWWDAAGLVARLSA